MDSYDVVVIGAGLAGLYCAHLLSQHGLHVLLVDRKPSLTTAIHTTGIFMRCTLEDFALPEQCLGPAVRQVRLYSPRLHHHARNAWDPLDCANSPPHWGRWSNITGGT